MDLEPQQSYLGLEPPAPPRTRARSVVALAAAALGVLAIGALAITTGGSGVADQTTEGEMALSGLQAPGNVALATQSWIIVLWLITAPAKQLSSRHGA